jgi:hypothetical protein
MVVEYVYAHMLIYTTLRIRILYTAPKMCRFFYLFIFLLFGTFGTSGACLLYVFEGKCKFVYITCVLVVLVDIPQY